ncbi:hypothetical protein ACIBKX_37435 [Streptomyces sp. NPDC050658]|uniref:hypothetical protein n=1 Tax=unclassified Streptomyces TaxID=2593676 RepID=UPI00343082F0
MFASMRAVRRRGAWIAVALLTMAGAAVAPTATAAPTLAESGFTCTGSVRFDYSPGLTHVPQLLTIDINGQLDNCTGAGSPSDSAELEPLSIHVTRSCTDLLVPQHNVETLEWSDGSTSVLDFQATSVYANGQLVATQVGSVTSGRFAGHTIAGTVTTLADLTKCSTPGGLSTLQGPWTLTFVPPL